MTPSVLDASRRVMARGSRSFFLASRLLPRRARHGTQLLYAWCRHCDDTIDGQRFGHPAPGPGADPGRTLVGLREATDAALGDGPVDGAPFVALRQVFHEHGIPPCYAREHLRGFAMDVAPVDPAGMADTVEYAYRVAGVVGVMIAWILEVRDRPTLERAADLGIAFQLTNIARDLLDDAAAGRCYLPRDLREAAGLPGPPDASDPARAAAARAVGRLLDEADRYYRSAEAGIDRLPLRAAWAIESASRVYRAIGAEVRRRGPRAWDRRVVVPTARKLALVLAAGAAVLWRRRPGRRAAAPRADLWAIPQPQADQRRGPAIPPNVPRGAPATGP